LDFLDRFSLNFTDNHHPVGDALMRADGWMDRKMDMMKPKGALCNLCECT